MIHNMVRWIAGAMMTLSMHADPSGRVDGSARWNYVSSNLIFLHKFSNFIVVLMARMRDPCACILNEERCKDFLKDDETKKKR